MKYEVKNLSISLDGYPILKNINFTLGQEFTILLGRNGAGKSTLLRAMAGMIPVLKEHLWYEGRDLLTMSLKQRGQIFSFIPQSFEESLDCTVMEFVLTGANPGFSFFEKPREEHRKRAREILKEDGISHLSHRKVSTLSGGERKMTYLSRSKMQNAQFLLLDEPTAYLDFQNQHEFMETLKKKVRQQEKGVFMTLHDPQLACRYGDRILFLHEKGILGDVRKEDEDYETKLLSLLRKMYGENIGIKNLEKEIFLTWEA